MKFSFRQFPIRESQAFPEKKSVYRPVIPVTLIHPNHVEKRLVLHCIVDTGADYCMFPTSIAAALGFYRVESGPTWNWASTDETSLVAYAHDITLELDNFTWECKALFSHDLNHVPYGILGLEGFFDRFNVHFNYKTQIFELSPNS